MWGGGELQQVLTGRRRARRRRAGPEAWQQVSPEARLWLRHVPFLHVNEYCNHRPANIHTRGVALDAADVAGRVGDWLLSTGRRRGE